MRRRKEPKTYLKILFWETAAYALTVYGLGLMWVRDKVQGRRTCPDCRVQGQVYWNPYNSVVQCHACGFQPGRKKLP